MLYTKGEIAIDGKQVTFNVPLIAGNIYSRCVDCGEELAIDYETIKDKDFDIESSHFLCEECAKRHDSENSDYSIPGLEDISGMLGSLTIRRE